METKTEPKSRITARVGESVQALLEEAAAYMGVPLNSFLVSAAVEKAGDVLTMERVIKLGQRDAELIEQMVQNPPEPNGALLEAFAEGERLVGE